MNINLTLKEIRNTFLGLLFVTLLLPSCDTTTESLVEIQQNSHISLIGNNLCSRMMNYGYFETALHQRYPDSTLYIRNFCDGGNTAGFRSHSGREEPWAFPGAEKFQTELAQESGSTGHFGSPDEWLSIHGTDIILAFFGSNESYQGQKGVENFKAEIRAFLIHTKKQQYNGRNTPEMVLVSPIAYEDLTDKFDLPNGDVENENLALYSSALAEVANEFGIPFIDVFSPSSEWFSGSDDFTIDGVQLNEQGYKKLSNYLAMQITGKKISKRAKSEETILAAVNDKNWFWHNDFKIPNGVHVYGRRYEPFGPDNYPEELTKVRQMTVNRDTAIWSAVQGHSYDLATADGNTITLTPVETNFKPKPSENKLEYKYGDDALNTITMAEGYEIALFASEQEFPDLANPVQLSFDNKGRLWVAVMPTYPHYKPGDSKPNDKLIILEDTDGDFKADKQTIFADNLHIPVGFEFAPEGVYISQGTNLKLLRDTDGDDKADVSEIILSGFDDHDTHHVISAFCADPSGAIYMGEGVFLHTDVETPYGPVRATNGGFYRYNPNKKHLERTAQLSIPNPWGIAFDEYGQNFFAQTSGPDYYWMMPGSIKSRYGVASPNSRNLIEDEHRVRPTSGVEFIHSSHFPDEVQGDYLINNNIGFLGTKQHSIVDDGTGYGSKHRQDLLVSSDPNFRPVDMEFAPDGSLYMVDWHNILVGHMQHNARDPLRDHAHGRIYRITYPSRPLVKAPKVDGASIEELLEVLSLPEYRARYRARRELRARDHDAVAAATKTWVDGLDKSQDDYEKKVLEGLWVSWGINKIDKDILDKALNAKDFRVRAAAVKVLRYNTDKISNSTELFMNAVRDDNSRVRLETIVTASWLDQKSGSEILAEAAKKPIDDWMDLTYKYSIAHLNNETIKREDKNKVISHLEGEDLASYIKGKEIFGRDGFCGTCHQEDGKGLKQSGYPPLAGTKWVLEDEDRLIKLTLKGLYGAITVLGEEYPGEVPMAPYGGMLNDEEMAAVLTYVRNSFGNKSPVITAKSVARVRNDSKGKEGFYSPEELLKEHPHVQILQ